MSVQDVRDQLIGGFLIRDRVYPVVSSFPVRLLSSEEVALRDHIKTERRVELIWTGPAVFPTDEEMHGAIMEARRRYAEPTYMVVLPRPGSKFAGVDLV